MRKDLHSLIRLGRWQVDERRRMLGVLLEREQEILDYRQHMERELKDEQAVAAGDALAAGLTYAGYAEMFIARRKTCETMLASVRQQIAAAREELAEAYRRLKSYELAQAARDKQRRLEEERRDQAMLDEVAQTMHRRKEG